MCIKIQFGPTVPSASVTPLCPRPYATFCLTPPLPPLCVTSFMNDPKEKRTKKSCPEN